MYKIVFETCINYNSEIINEILEKYGKDGFQLVSATIIKDKFYRDTLGLFFQKQIKD